MRSSCCSHAFYVHEEKVFPIFYKIEIVGEEVV